MSGTLLLRKDAFQLEKYNAAMAATGQYSAAGNLFWINLAYSPCPAVPINANAVKMLQRQFFSVPTTRYPWTIHCLLDAAKDIDGALTGALKRVSPEEGEHALLLAIADSIRKGHDEGELKSDPQLVRFVLFDICITVQEVASLPPVSHLLL